MCRERLLLRETQESQYHHYRGHASCGCHLAVPIKPCVFEILATELNDGYTYQPVGQMFRKGLGLLVSDSRRLFPTTMANKSPK